MYNTSPFDWEKGIDLKVNKLFCDYAIVNCEL